MWLDFLMVGLSLVLGWLGWVLVRCGSGCAASLTRNPATRRPKQCSPPATNPSSVSRKAISDERPPARPRR